MLVVIIRKNDAEMYMRYMIFGQVQTDGQTESDAYEPTVQIAQVGSISHHSRINSLNVTFLSCLIIFDLTLIQHIERYADKRIDWTLITIKLK